MVIGQAIPKCKSMSDTALLVEFDAVISPQVNQQVRKLMTGLARKEMDGLVEIVPAYRSLLIHYNPCKISTGRLYEQVENVAENLAQIVMPKARKFYLPVCYDDTMGLDLAHVAKYHKLSA
ncbi:MAG TPA: carboxyltransferase domain-containing protein, partial [Candidatus Acetothermia bacterium]|nr:carboxyltransferase domain-containing protein [Candidatus Acetothermia bacterium]